MSESNKPTEADRERENRERTTTCPPRRRAMFPISSDPFRRLFEIGTAWRIVETDVPANAKYLAVTHCWERDCVLVVVESPDLGIVPEGQLLPMMMGPTFERVSDYPLRSARLEFRAIQLLAHEFAEGGHSSEKMDAIRLAAKTAVEKLDKDIAGPDPEFLILALQNIADMEVLEIDEDAGPEDMSQDAKGYCAAFGACVDIARRALGTDILEKDPDFRVQEDDDGLTPSDLIGGES